MISMIQKSVYCTFAVDTMYGDSFMYGYLGPGVREGVRSCWEIITRKLEDPCPSDYSP